MHKVGGGHEVPFLRSYLHTHKTGVHQANPLHSLFMRKESIRCQLPAAYAHRSCAQQYLKVALGQPRDTELSACKFVSDFFQQTSPRRDGVFSQNEVMGRTRHYRDVGGPGAYVDDGKDLLWNLVNSV